jgi:hypothetical protein
MKQLSVLMLLCIFASCRAPRFYMGESEQEFIKHNRVEMVSATSRSSIYKKVNYPFGGAPVTKYFYFTDGKLTQVDQGVRSPDIIVEHRN